MNQATRPEPESWDEATDLRRFWWLIPPLTFAFLTIGVIYQTGSLRGGDGLERKDEEVHQVFRVGDAPEIDIDNISGEILVEPGDVGTIEVSVQRQGVGTSEEAAFANLTRLQIRMQQFGDRVTVTTFEDPPSGIAGGTRAQIHVIVPRSAAVRASTGSGLVQVNGVEGDIQARTGLGTVDVIVVRDAAFNLVVSATRLTTNFDLVTQKGASDQSIRATVGVNPRRTFLLSAPSGSVIIRHPE